MPAAAGGKALTLEQAFTSTHMILGELQSPASLQMLSSVRETGDTLTKWQQVNGLLVSATLRVLPQVGYSADGQGLQAYTMSFAECARTNSPEASGKLQELNTAKWRVLLEHAFGCEPAPPMTLAKARELAIDIVDAMQDPALLKQVGKDAPRARERAHGTPRATLTPGPIHGHAQHPTLHSWAKSLLCDRSTSPALAWRAGCPRQSGSTWSRVRS